MSHNKFMQKTVFLYLITFLIFFFQILGCASRSIVRIHDTGNTREVKSSTDYGFLASSPTPDNPYLIFKMVQTDTYIYQKEVQEDVVTYKKLGNILKLTLLPLWVSVGVVSGGEVNIYKEREKVGDSDKNWENDTSRKDKKHQIDLANITVHLKYEYAGKNIKIDIKTDSQGFIELDTREIAKSIARDPYAQKYVEFFITADPPYKCNNEIKIPQEDFIQIYQKWSEDGYY